MECKSSVLATRVSLIFLCVSVALWRERLNQRGGGGGGGGGETLNGTHHTTNSLSSRLHYWSYELRV